MSDNKPILAIITWYLSGGHAIVISGTDYSDGNYLRVMDPDYGWYYPSYSDFKSSYQGNGTWVASVYFN